MDKLGNELRLVPIPSPLPEIGSGEEILTVLFEAMLIEIFTSDYCHKSPFPSRVFSFSKAEEFVLVRLVRGQALDFKPHFPKTGRGRCQLPTPPFCNNDWLKGKPCPAS